MTKTVIGIGIPDGKIMDLKGQVNKSYHIRLGCIKLGNITGELNGSRLIIINLYPTLK